MELFFCAFRVTSLDDCEASLLSMKKTLRDSWQIEHTVRLSLVPLGVDICEEVRASDLRIAIVATDSEFSEVYHPPLIGERSLRRWVGTKTCRAEGPWLLAR